MIKHFSILLILLSTVTQAYAQTWTTYYEPYGGYVTQWALSFIEKDNGNIVFCGMSDTVDQDGFISEIDSNGAILNELYIGGTWNDQLLRIFPNDSGYISLGYQQDFDNYTYSMYSYIILDSNLNIKKEYIDSISGVAKGFSDFCTDSYYIYGVRYNTSTLFLTKLDMYGNIIWETSYNNFPAPQSGKIIFTKDNNLLISGTVDQTETISNEAFLLKLDTSGNTIWQRILAGPDSRFIGGLNSTQDSGAVFILLDEYDLVNYTGGEFKLLEYDFYGNETQNMALYDSSVWDYVEKTSLGYLLGGFIYDDQAYRTSAIGKAGFNEVLMPLDTFNFANYSRIYNLISLEHSQGTLLVGGYKSVNWHTDNLFISKIQNNQITWTTFINELPLDKKIKISCYPNPAQNYINISFENNQTKQNLVVIADLNGKILYQKSINSSNLILDVSRYPSGAYIISVNNGDYRGQSLFVKR